MTSLGEETGCSALKGRGSRREAAEAAVTSEGQEGTSEHRIPQPVQGAEQEAETPPPTVHRDPYK